MYSGFLGGETMNLKTCIFILVSFLTLVGCSEGNYLADVEAKNHYVWQKYMNEEEFNQVQEGMTYIDVVEIAKGRGEQLDEETYMWLDEIMLTQVYEITFVDDKVTEKKIVERRGASVREDKEN